jgi:aconitate hydratase
MSFNITEKIIKEHLVSGTMKPGSTISIKIDQTLTQDATGTMVYLQFESMDIPRVKTELSVSYVDHNTLQSDYRNADDHNFLQSIAKKYGIYFSKPGNGICHQVHLERFGIPGKTLLGSDSHTPTGGGLGMLAIGAGGLDVATAMAGAPFNLIMPYVSGVKLTGKLQPMVSAKDIILKLLQLETVKGGVGRVYEYFGEGVESLTVPERATITNMGAELGATTSVFPSDEKTLAFMKLQKREAFYRELKADEGCGYDKIIEIDLNTLEPMAACPHMPDNVKTVREIAGLKVDQVAIGSCTNSSINDIGIAADILAGKTAAENVSLGISPGSRQVFESSVKAGLISKLLLSGARFLESACGPCIGMGFSPPSKGVSLRTFNRNFTGRSGTDDASVYLVSPETAAASALKGVITDPRTLAGGIRKADYTSFLSIDDSMIIPPVSEALSSTIEIVRGPNIKPCPKGRKMPEKLDAQIIIKTGDNITTDHIMPAGSKILPLRSNIPEISKHVFEALDPDFHLKAQKAGDGIIAGGENYGQGSSREHAALAPMYLGIRAVIAKSFARIHKANLVNFGILPLVFENPADYEKIEAGMKISFPELLKELKSGSTKLTALIPEKALTINLKCDVPAESIEIALAGGLLNYARDKN